MKEIDTILESTDAVELKIDSNWDEIERNQKKFYTKLIMNVLSTGINEWELRMMEIKKDMMNILNKSQSINTSLAKDINLVHMEAQTHTGLWAPINCDVGTYRQAKLLTPEYLSKKLDNLFQFMAPMQIEVPGLDDVINNEVNPQIVEQYGMTPKQFTPITGVTHDELRITNVGNIYSYDNDDDCVLHDMNNAPVTKTSATDPNEPVNKTSATNPNAPDKNTSAASTEVKLDSVSDDDDFAGFTQKI